MNLESTITITRAVEVAVYVSGAQVGHAEEHRAACFVLSSTFRCSAVFVFFIC